MKKIKLPQEGKNKKLLVISIVAVSVLIVAGIGYFFYLIYHKDEPKFVPGDTRGEIREGIKEKIAEPLADVWPAVGEPLIDAVYTTPASTTGTENWQTYTYTKTNISIEYPASWSVFEGRDGVFSFSPNEDSYDSVSVFVSTKTTINKYWEEYAKDWDAIIDGPDQLQINNKTFSVYKQLDGMQEKHYLISIDSNVYDIMPTGDGYTYVEKMLGSIH